MSQQLDSMLNKLKKAIAEKESEPDAVKKALVKEVSVDTRAASQALKDFIAKTTVQKVAEKAQDDPKLLAARRKALSDFVGSPLGNNGVAALSGTISESSQKNASRGHGHGTQGHAASGHTQASAPAEPVRSASVPFTPPPAPVMAICPKCIAGENNPAIAAAKGKAEGSKLEELKAELESVKAELEKSKEEAAKAKSSTPVMAGTALSGISASAPISVSRPVISDKPPAQEKPSTQDAPEMAPAKKGGMASLFAAFKPGAKSNNQESKSSDESKGLKDETPVPEPAAVAVAKPSAPAPSVASLAWFKHIQAVESALRIGDVLFADSLLALLMEVSKSLSAEANITARLQSLQARVMLDRKQYAEVEALLNQTIKELESSSYAKNIANAYCWHALAVCYKQQKKADEAESARQKAIEISEAAVGPKDPEAMYFKEPLP